MMKDGMLHVCIMNCDFENWEQLNAKAVHPALCYAFVGLKRKDKDSQDHGKVTPPNIRCYLQQFLPVLRFRQFRQSLLESFVECHRSTQR